MPAGRDSEPSTNWLGREADSALVSALMDEAPLGFALIDADLRFVRVNRELAAMNRLTVAEMDGRPAFEVVPGVRETAEPLLRKVLESGEAIRDVPVHGWTAARPDLTGTWLESFFPVRAPRGPVVAVAVVARDVTQLTALQEQMHETVQRQRDALLDLQTSLLPRVPDLSPTQVAARYLGASATVALGGDWFDVVRGPDGRLALCVGDVTGHGLTAVGAMARVSGAMHAYVCDGYGPPEVLERVNRLVADRSSPGLATAAVAFLDESDGTVEFASAGHPPPLLRTPDGSVMVLDGGRGLLLGARSDSRYSADRVTVPPDAALLLYTDGLVERPGETIDEGIARLAGAFAGARATDDAEAAIDHLLETCLDDRPRRDDVCILDVRRPGAAHT